MSIDRMEQDLCADCVAADHCYACPCCIDDDDPDDHDRLHPWMFAGCDDCAERADWLEAQR